MRTISKTGIGPNGSQRRGETVSLKQAPKKEEAIAHRPIHPVARHLHCSEKDVVVLKMVRTEEARTMSNDVESKF